MTSIFQKYSISIINKENIGKHYVVYLSSLRLPAQLAIFSSEQLAQQQFLEMLPAREMPIGSSKLSPDRSRRTPQSKAQVVIRRPKST